ncbi:hypothetical protein [Candidatus Vidania fulgoroideorum]
MQNIIIEDLIKKKSIIALGEGRRMEKFENINNQKITTVNKKIKSMLKKKKNYIDFNKVNVIDVFIGEYNYKNESFYIKNTSNFSKEKIIMNKSNRCILIYEKKSTFISCETQLFSKNYIESILKYNNMKYLIKKKKKKIIFNENNFVIFLIYFKSKIDILYKYLIIKLLNSVSNSIFFRKKNIEFIEITNKKIIKK